MNEIQSLKEKQTIVKAALSRAQASIVRALPRHLDSERMFRIYLAACNTSPQILDCDPISIVGAVMRAAAFGLSLESVTGEAFIIPRRSRNMNGRHVANFQIGYKGLLKLALQGDPELRDVFAYAVYENDVFEYTLGAEPRIRAHKPAPGSERGKLSMAYAVAVWKDGYRRFEVIDSQVIELAKRYAGGLDKPDSPWNTNTEAMWRKTALRRLCSQLSLSSDVAREVAREGTDGQDALRERADIDPNTRSLLVDLGAASIMDTPIADGGDEPSAPSHPSVDGERKLDGEQRPPRQRRRRRGDEAPPNGAGVGESRDPGQEG